MDDTDAIDTKRFALMLQEPPPPPKPLSEMRVPDPDGKKGPYAVVWCYFAQGGFKKYTGRLASIETWIEQSQRPCLACVCRGKSLPCQWRFFNAPRLKVRHLLRASFPDEPLRSFGRTRGNDRFAIVHSDVDGKVLKEVRYRRLPQAFPRAFLYAIEAAGRTTEPVTSPVLDGWSPAFV